MPGTILGNETKAVNKRACPQNLLSKGRKTKSIIKCQDMISSMEKEKNQNQKNNQTMHVKRDEECRSRWIGWL